jgi:ferritin
MRMIKKLAGQIDEEIGDAMKYARCAANYKESEPDLSRLYADLSEQELKHMQKLHDAVVMLIDRARNEEVEVPVGMMEMYDFLHERNIEKAAEVRMILQEVR